MIYGTYSLNVEPDTNPLGTLLNPVNDTCDEPETTPAGICAEPLHMPDKFVAVIVDVTLKLPVTSEFDFNEMVVPLSKIADELIWSPPTALGIKLLTSPSSSPKFPSFLGPLIKIAELYGAAESDGCSYNQWF